MIFGSLLLARGMVSVSLVCMYQGMLLLGPSSHPFRLRHVAAWPARHVPGVVRVPAVVKSMNEMNKFKKSYT